MDDLSKLKHVVVLSLENRSFDHVFGGLRAEGNAIDVADRDRWTNDDREGHTWGIGALADNLASSFRPDPDHGWEGIETQVARDGAGNATMGGFVKRWVDVHRDAARPRDAVLAYLSRNHQPVTYFFAEQYTVLERYFASVACGTLPNRFYALCGDAAGHRDNSIRKELLLDLTTVFDNLPADSWRVYAGALPTLLLVGDLGTKRRNLRNIRRLSRFFRDAQQGDLPRLSWLEPTFDWSASFLARLFGVPDGPPNDDHPPSSTARGQKLLHDVYSELIRDPARWSSTLLIVYYDEHGGFFDHVSPPALPVVGTDGIRWFGPRVPAMLISPFAARAGRDKTQFDHCSVIRFISDWFDQPAPNRAGSPHTASVAGALLDKPRTDPTLPPPPPPPQPQAVTPGQEPPAGEVERSIMAFVDGLEAEDRATYDALIDALR